MHAIEALPRGSQTSAEPNHFDSPWDELHICQETVLANMVADLGDVPLLTSEELGWCRILLRPTVAELPRARWFVRIYLLSASRKLARDAVAAERGSIRDRPIPRLNPEVVKTAAFRVERAVQDRLWHLGGPGSVIGDPRYARALWDAQWQAHRAVVAKTGRPKQAKDLREAAAHGRRSLTVCCGRQLRRLPEDVLRKHAPDLLEHYGENIVPLGYGDGCWAIILDTTEPRPPQKYCDRCDQKAGNTMNAGLAKNARAKLRASRKR
jgi:hypothetical protein